MSLSCRSETSLLSHSSSAFSLSMNNCRTAQEAHVNKHSGRNTEKKETTKATELKNIMLILHVEKPF